MKIPMKIGLIASGLFAIYEVYGFLTFKGFDAMVPPFLLILVTPVLVVYLGLVFAWYRSRKLFQVVVGSIVFLVILSFVLEKIDYNQSVNSSNLSQGMPLDIGKEVSYEARGLYPLYNSYRFTVPEDGDYKVSFNSDIQIADFSPMTIYSGKVIEVYEDFFAYPVTLYNLLSAIHLVKFNQPGVGINFKNKIWEGGHYANGWAIVRNAKKGETYGILIHQRELAIGGRANYYSLKVEPVKSNMIDVFNNIHGSTAELKNTIERYTFIPNKDSKYAVITMEDYLGKNEQFPITVKKNNETVETKVEKDKRLIAFLVFCNVKAGEPYILELDRTALVKGKENTFQIWVRLTDNENWR